MNSFKNFMCELMNTHSLKIKLMNAGGTTIKLMKINFAKINNQNDQNQ